MSLTTLLHYFLPRLSLWISGFRYLVQSRFWVSLYPSSLFTGGPYSTKFLIINKFLEQRAYSAEADGMWTGSRVAPASAYPSVGYDGNTGSVVTLVEGWEDPCLVDRFSFSLGWDPRSVVSGGWFESFFVCFHTDLKNAYANAYAVTRLAAPPIRWNRRK